MTSDVSSTSTGGKSSTVSVSLGEQGGQSVFKLAYRGEVLPLLDSGSLNRWASIGIVDRHKISTSQDGVTIDGRHFAYSDLKSPAEMERLLNRPQSTAPAQPRPDRQTDKEHPRAAAPASPDQIASDLRDSLRVTRDGFEYHVTFITRFGQNKTEGLQAALETFQNMRAFKPHVNMQKSGIRLVVTRWDGESFVEEPGIENVEHASAEEVEALIRNNLQGAPDEASSTRPLRGTKPPVVRLELVRKSHDLRYQLLLHRADGSAEEGPLLIRANMAKLNAERLFRPDVTVSMTAMNDRILVEHGTSAGGGKHTDALPLSKPEDVAAIQEIFNRFLRLPEVSVSSFPVVQSSAPADVNEPVAPPREISGVTALVEKPLIEVMPAPELTTPEPKAVELPSVPPVEPAVPPGSPAATIEAAPQVWLADLLKGVAQLPPEEISRDVFAALRDTFERPISSNDHGFPTFELEFITKSDTPARVEFVLTPHFLICNYPIGYMRFGAETRLFLSRLDDYTAFPGHALRGVAHAAGKGGPVFIISDEFSRFLQNNGDRSYKTHFADALINIAGASPERLIWPISREEHIFHLTARAAKSYGFPVESDKVLLGPSAPVFIGFKKAAPHGMEFRDGEDYIRFTPWAVEMNDDGESHQMAGSKILLGWALDAEGRVCALYRRESGFTPPEFTKLLRFLSEEEKERESNSINVLAWVPA